MLSTPKMPKNKYLADSRRKQDFKLVAAIAGLCFGCMLLTAGLMSMPGKGEPIGAGSRRRMLATDEPEPAIPAEETPVATSEMGAPKGIISRQKMLALPTGRLKFDDGFLGFDRDQALFSDEYDLVPEKEKATHFRVRAYKEKGKVATGKYLIYLEADGSLLTAAQENRQQRVWQLSKAGAEGGDIYTVNVENMCDHRNCVISSTKMTATLLFGRPKGTQESAAMPPAEEVPPAREEEEVTPPDQEAEDGIPAEENAPESAEPTSEQGAEELVL